MKSCAASKRNLAATELRRRGKTMRLRMRNHTPLPKSRAHCSRPIGQRTLVALSLMAAQAFFYNAIFFTYALILTDFYRTPADRIGWYILPFAAGNVLGPILLGRLFDTVGRKTMIASTYAISGIAARRHRRTVQPRSCSRRRR